MNLLEPLKATLSIFKVASALGLDFKPLNGKALLLCPFHKDDSPSFSLVESGKNGEGFYHCFGCQKSGDVFSLAQKLRSLPFPEAKQFVYSVNGFAVETPSYAPASQLKSGTIIPDTVQKVFEENSEIQILKSVMETIGFKKSIPASLSSPEELTEFLEKKISRTASISWKTEAMAFYGFYANDTLFFYLGEPYMRRNNRWLKLSDTELARLSVEFLEHRFGENWVTKTKNQDMLYFIRTYARIVENNNSFLCSAPDSDNTITSVLLQNKILSVLANGEIELLDPKKTIFFSTAQWNVSLNESDTTAMSAPVFQQYLKRVQPKEENQILLMELMGYMLVPDNRLQKFFILKGEGKNGKSVFLSILKDMIGEGNYTSLSLDQLEKSYALSALIGKTANICADMGEIDKAAEGLLKSITSGDQITCDRKYLSAVTFLPTAKHVFSTNNIPRFSDKSEGLWRRMIIIPFDEILDDNEIDVSITEKLKKEIDQIFLFALEGLKRIIKNGWRFTIPENIKNTLNEERDNASTLRQFVNSQCTLAPDESIETQKYYHEYCLWTRANGQSPSSKNSIGRELVRFGIKSKTTSFAGESVRKYFGISLKE